MWRMAARGRRAEPPYEGTVGGGDKKEVEKKEEMGRAMGGGDEKETLPFVRLLT